MSLQQFTNPSERFIRRYEYDDRWVIAADLGVSDDDVDVDIVGTTAMIVVDAGDDVFETEFELPAEEAEVLMQNGVITICGYK